MQFCTLKLLILLLFVIVCLTDFFDGFLARIYNCQTRIGAVLDHFADKVLVLGTLLPLVYLNRIHFFWALLFIMRELYILLLRYTACSYGIQLNVCWYGKVKTWLQFVYLLLVFGFMPTCGMFLFIEKLFLFLAVIATIVSAVMYSIGLVRSIRKAHL